MNHKVPIYISILSSTPGSDFLPKVGHAALYPNADKELVLLFNDGTTKQIGKDVAFVLNGARLPINTGDIGLFVESGPLTAYFNGRNLVFNLDSLSTAEINTALQQMRNLIKSEIPIKAYVDTEAELPSALPNPQKGWGAVVGMNIYLHNGTSWVNITQINSQTFILASDFYASTTKTIIPNSSDLFELAPDMIGTRVFTIKYMGVRGENACEGEVRIVMHNSTISISDSQVCVGEPGITCSTEILSSKPYLRFNVDGSLSETCTIKIRDKIIDKLSN